MQKQRWIFIMTLLRLHPEPSKANDQALDIVPNIITVVKCSIYLGFRILSWKQKILGLITVKNDRFEKHVDDFQNLSTRKR